MGGRHGWAARVGGTGGRLLEALDDKAITQSRNPDTQDTQGHQRHQRHHGDRATCGTVSGFLKRSMTPPPPMRTVSASSSAPSSARSSCE
eukprot:3541587-Prymnesium_polylepis.1